jgi:hypothetical protein
VFIAAQQDHKPANFGYGWVKDDSTPYLGSNLTDIKKSITLIFLTEKQMIKVV